MARSSTSFRPGQTGNPRGRPRKGTSLRELLRRRPLKDKRALVDVAYREAVAGNVHWAEWIAKHSGEGAAPAGSVQAEAGCDGPLVFTIDIPHSDHLDVPADAG
jgi:hypothetical protein